VSLSSSGHLKIDLKYTVISRCRSFDSCWTRICLTSARPGVDVWRCFKQSHTTRSRISLFVFHYIFISSAFRYTCVVPISKGFYHTEGSACASITLSPGSLPLCFVRFTIELASYLVDGFVVQSFWLSSVEFLIHSTFGEGNAEGRLRY
jgi:hypothetical protein